MSGYESEQWFTPTELHKRVTRLLLLLGAANVVQFHQPFPVSNDERDVLVTAGLVVADEMHITAITDRGMRLIQRLMSHALDDVIADLAPNCGDTVRIESTAQLGTLIGYGNTTCAVELADGEERDVRKRDCVLVSRREPRSFQG